MSRPDYEIRPGRIVERGRRATTPVHVTGWHGPSGSRAGTSDSTTASTNRKPQTTNLKPQADRRTGQTGALEIKPRLQTCQNGQTKPPPQPHQNAKQTANQIANKTANCIANFTPNFTATATTLRRRTWNPDGFTRMPPVNPTPDRTRIKRRQKTEIKVKSCLM